jgi:hypothetical protein
MATTLADVIIEYKMSFSNGSIQFKRIAMVFLHSKWIYIFFNKKIKGMGGVSFFS